MHCLLIRHFMWAKTIYDDDTQDKVCLCNIYGIYHKTSWACIVDCCVHKLHGDHGWFEMVNNVTVKGAC